MSQIDVDLPEAFLPILEPSDYKGFYGGRGSAKTWSVAAALVAMGANDCKRILCCREIQKSIKDSSKAVLDDQVNRLGLRGFYVSTDNEIRGQNGTLFTFKGLRTGPESVKSTEGIDIVWVDEAEMVSEHSSPAWPLHGHHRC